MDIETKAAFLSELGYTYGVIATYAITHDLSSLNEAIDKLHAIHIS